MTTNNSIPFPVDTDHTYPALYPMKIGQMDMLRVKTARGPVMINMAHFVRAEMSGGALFIRLTDTPPVKVAGADFQMLDVAIRRFHRTR